MLPQFIKKIFDTNSKTIARYQTLVDKINSLESATSALSDEQLKAKTQDFKNRLSSGDALDSLLPEAFAVVRESSKRVIEQRHFDVQLMAGIAFHEGKVAEQKTGEGKTLSATSAVYLNALTGKSVHVVTVNDYLSRIGGGWMGQVYTFLGITTSILIHDQSFIYDPQYSDPQAQDWRFAHLRPVSRKEAYNADVVYGTNNEFGFDYLRDNMANDIAQVVQRGHFFAIVDEVDSILIDEARTPLIISAPDAQPTDKYYEFAKLVDYLSPKLDFIVNEKHKSATLTESGIKKLEKRLGLDNLYEKDFETVHHVENALRAKALFLKDRDYVVKDGEVIIVDEFTGRLMIGRRYSEGLHQAIEAKEGVKIQQESKTLATISIQNYFRMYEKLAGMTGTAATEAEEFEKIYKMEVVVIPTHKAVIRKDYPDYIYKNERSKLEAIVREIEKVHATGQPILVGTRDIEHNDLISRLLKHKGIKHEVLNAKNHFREALIISRAGEKGAVTIATNMAGRGVDITLGGVMPQRAEGLTDEEYRTQQDEWKKKYEEVLALGGLFVIGTERHESRRIDNQLRGRSGRQGDPGATRFFVALSDEIIRVFGGDKIAGLMTMMNMPENVPIEHAMVSKAIENAQAKVEGFYFDMRKSVVEYDDVMNKQRDILYKLRRKILETQFVSVSDNTIDNNAGTHTELRAMILNKVEQRISKLINEAMPEEFDDQSYERIVQEFAQMIPFDQASIEQLKSTLKQKKTQQEVADTLEKTVNEIYASRVSQFGAEAIFHMEKKVYLDTIDELWISHLDNMTALREGIGLRAYGQRDPLVEYKAEGFRMFQKLLSDIDFNLTQRIFKVVPANAYEMFMQNMLQQAHEVGPNPNASSSTDLSTQTASATIANSLEPLSQIVKPNMSDTQAPAQENLSDQEKADIKEFFKTMQRDVQKGPGRASQKIGRNDPCWCGSGKKWKKCHYPQQP